MKTGAQLIADERLRQIKKEGWSKTHDQQHNSGELVDAAICYATPPKKRKQDFHLVGDHRNGVGRYSPKLWPWSLEWWKPEPDDRVRELTKAGALIAAEIDRMQRMRHTSGSRDGGNL